MTTVEVDLFLCGAVTERSATVLRNLSIFCSDRYGDDCSINVIDVLGQPELAERANVIATPLVVVRRPLPALRFVGDLSRIDPDAWPPPREVAA